MTESNTRVYLLLLGFRYLLRCCIVEPGMGLISCQARSTHATRSNSQPQTAAPPTMCGRIIYVTVFATRPITPKKTLTRVSLLDTLEGVGQNNTELEQLAAGGWGGKDSNNNDENRNEDDFGTNTGRKTADDWLIQASSIGEETLVSSSLCVGGGSTHSF